MLGCLQATTHHHQASPPVVCSPSAEAQQQPEAALSTAALAEAAAAPAAAAAHLVGPSGQAAQRGAGCRRCPAAVLWCQCQLGGDADLLSWFGGSYQLRWHMVPHHCLCCTFQPPGTIGSFKGQTDPSNDERRGPRHVVQPHCRRTLGRGTAAPALLGQMHLPRPAFSLHHLAPFGLLPCLPSSRWSTGEPGGGG